MRNRKWLAMLLAVLMIVGCLTACASDSGKDTPSTNPKVTQAPASAGETTNPPAAEDEEMSYEELVSAAKAEGKLVFYGANSYLQDAANLFAQEFGIEVEFTQLGETEMIEKVSSECNAGAVVADLVCAQDTYRVQSDILNTGYAKSWSNSRLAEITGTEDCTALIWYYDTKMFMFNPTLVGEDWAVNLWRATDPAYRGLFTMKTPTSEGVNFNMLTMLTSDEYAAKLESAYEEYYGRKLELTTDNAGWEFVKMLYENDVLLTTSDSTCATTIGDLSLKDTWIGYFSTQRYSTQESKGIKLAFDYEGTAPVSGYAYPVYAIVLNGCQHENAAKLFAEWLLSENGWKAFETYFGGFSANPANVHATEFGFDDLKPYIVMDNPEYLLDNRVDMEDFIDAMQ